MHNSPLVRRTTAALLGLAICSSATGQPYMSDGIETTGVIAIGGAEGMPHVVTTFWVPELPPDIVANTKLFDITTHDTAGVTGIRIVNICKTGGGCNYGDLWNLQLTASAQTKEDGGYTFSYTLPTTYSISIGKHDRLEIGDYTINIDTTWIY